MKVGLCQCTDDASQWTHGHVAFEVSLLRAAKRTNKIKNRTLMCGTCVRHGGCGARVHPDDRQGSHPSRSDGVFVK